MVTFTTNKALGLPAVGGDTGVWGPPLNNNSSAIDMSFGGSVTIPISTVSGAITLLASNYLNVFLTFTGTLSQNTIVTMPAVGSFYTVQNLTGASSQFTVTLATTAAGSQVIGAPPFQPQDIFTDGSNVKFNSLPHVGSYWDYAGTTVPNWVTACTIKPWLNCDGTQFSSATYPYLATILGSTTLPDSRGRYRASLNQTTGRLSSSQIGFSGDTLLASGGTTAISSQNLPSTALTEPSSGHRHPLGGDIGYLNPSGATAFAIGTTGPEVTGYSTTGITFGSSSPTGIVPPSYIGGLTLIRAG